SSFFFQAEDGIRDATVTGVQTCALPISPCESWPRGSVRDRPPAGPGRPPPGPPAPAPPAPRGRARYAAPRPLRAARDSRRRSRQIGRASCRESGEVGVGGGCAKKEAQNT